MPGRLDGRVVLITGAASGIGRETALHAAREGAAIGAVDIDGDGLASLADEVGAAVRVADVSDADALAAAVGELATEVGPLDVAFANAGILAPPAAVDDLDLADWDRVLAVNLTGVLLTFRAALAHFNADGGALLATGSSLAVRPRPGVLPYIAAKAGLHAIVRPLALELAPRGIRVNVIAPGLADTAMTRNVPGHIERGLEGVPTGRLVEVGNVASLAVHLMTGDARSVTGTVFTIDEGRTAG
ncbi:MAG TPA: SDR family NAD(P)-dependent oxidoreductase [Acidimicrobiales bacterium]|nr:SDR family NAD(P)-dependent oxidoreductase [Acidimicrobiales bacterium]